MLVVLLADLFGPLVVFASWALAAAGLAGLAREPDVERPAAVGLVALVLAVVVALGGAGLTLAASGKVLGGSPGYDTTSISLSLGVVGAWIAAAAFVAAFDARVARRRLGLVAAVVALVAAALFVVAELSRAGLLSTSLVVGAGAQSYTLGAAMVLVVAALARISFSPEFA